MKILIIFLFFYQCLFANIESLAGYKIGDNILNYKVKDLDNVMLLKDINSYKDLVDRDFKVKLRTQNDKIQEISATLTLFDFKIIKENIFEERFNKIIKLLEIKYNILFNADKYEKPWYSLIYSFKKDNIEYKIFFNKIDKLIFIEYRLSDLSLFNNKVENKLKNEVDTIQNNKKESIINIDNI